MSKGKIYYNAFTDSLIIITIKLRFLTNDLIKYYKNFFEWLKNEEDLGIILKSQDTII